MIDLATLTRIAAIRPDSPPAALTFAPDGTHLYLTMPDMRTILTLDPVQKKIVGRITVPPGSRHLVAAEDGRAFLVVTNMAGAGALEIVNLPSGTVSGMVAVGTTPAWVAVDQDMHMAYVTNEHSRDVSIVDLDTRRVAATITVGHRAGEIVLPPPAAPGRSAVQTDGLEELAQAPVRPAP